MSNKNKHRTQALPLMLQLSVKRNLDNYTENGVVHLGKLMDELIIEFNLFPTDKNEINFAQINGKITIRDFPNVLENYVNTLIETQI